MRETYCPVTAARAVPRPTGLIGLTDRMPRAERTRSHGAWVPQRSGGLAFSTNFPPACAINIGFMGGFAKRFPANRTPLPAGLNSGFAGWQALWCARAQEPGCFCRIRAFPFPIPSEGKSLADPVHRHPGARAICHKLPIVRGSAC